MTTQATPFVSIVTPVFNGERFIAEAIESVLSQTYDNWEYVIVNNCSTDRTLDIAETYARRDERVRIHNNSEFFDVIENFNNSLRQISKDSKYCKMLLADDLLFPECIATMVEVAERHPSAGMVGAYVLEGNKVTMDGISYPTSLLSGKEACRMHLLDGTRKTYFFGSATSTLLRSDVVRNRQQFYNTENLHADTEVCFDVLQDFDFGFAHQVLTYTRKHPQSITSSAQKKHTHIIGKMIILQNYGPFYLNDEELKKVTKREYRYYYRLLAFNLLKHRDKSLWHYHRSASKKFNIELSLVKLLQAACAVTCNRLLRRLAP